MEKAQMKTKKCQNKTTDLTQFLSSSLIDKDKYRQIKEVEKSNNLSQNSIKNDTNAGDFKSLKFVDFNSNLQNNEQKQPKTAKKHNKLDVLRQKNLTDWIEIVFAVSPYIQNMAEFVDGMVEKVAESSFSTTLKCGGVQNVFERVIDIIERKHQLVNLSVVSAEFYQLVASDEEKQIVQTTLDKTKKIVEIAENGKYNWVYRAKVKFLKKVVEYCRIKGYDEEFFFKHFAAEPLIQYYV